MGMILASLQIGFLFGVVFMNASRLDPKRLIHFGGVCYVVGPAIIAYNPGLWTLCLGRFIEGFGAAPLVISHDSTLARKLKPNQKGRAFGSFKVKTPHWWSSSSMKHEDHFNACGDSLATSPAEIV